MSTKLLPRSYTAEELDEGAGMTYHPVTGQMLFDLYHDGECYDRWLYWMERSDEYKDTTPRPFVFDESGGLPAALHTFLPAIGDGKKHQAGTYYPRHWIYDPYTGADMNRKGKITDSDSRNEPCGGEW